MSALPAGVCVVLLDIEGTTTRTGFVHETLFLYARAHLDAFLARRFNDPDVRDGLDLLAVEHGREKSDDPPPAWQDAPTTARIESAARYLHWLMDRDRKSPALKSLQGFIWEEGYQNDELNGEVFDDVLPALERWRAAGLEIAIYSSGSQLAQRRLFASTPQGDLTLYLRAFFDTGVGAKMSPASYRQIATALGQEPESMLFVSDVSRELQAARAAGCHVVLCIRPGNPPQPEAASFPQIRSFDELR